MKIILQLLAILQKGQEAEAQRVIEYIDACLSHLKTILFMEKHSQEEVEYSRKYLQKAHQQIFGQLDGIASAKESDIIRKSLMSGRVFYHAAKYSFEVDEQTRSDYNDRYYGLMHEAYGQDEFRLNSNEVLLKQLARDGEQLERDELQDRLVKIKEVCKEDILRIETLREEIKSRVVFVVKRAGTKRR